MIIFIYFIVEVVLIYFYYFN